jgi:chemotaxis protein methyltransferase CheR
MTSPKAPEDASRILVQPAIAQLLRDLIHERIGVYFESDRLDMMIEKLETRVTARGCQSYLDYYYILKYDENAPEEWRSVMDAFSVQETYFWREPDQFRALVDIVVPQWFKRTSQPLRIWSAACATGEEPYSIAMALCEAGFGEHPIEILASDASEAALAKARAGVFRERSFRALAPTLRGKYFAAHGDGSLLHSDIRSRVRFEWANLVSLSDFPPAGNIHVIFCRNVFIYFSPTSIKRVITSFARRVPVDGHLFIGSSESLLKITEDFELHELGDAFVYCRKAVCCP